MPRAQVTDPLSTGERGSQGRTSEPDEGRTYDLLVRFDQSELREMVKKAANDEGIPMNTWAARVLNEAAKASRRGYLSLPIEVSTGARMVRRGPVGEVETVPGKLGDLTPPEPQVVHRAGPSLSEVLEAQRDHSEPRRTAVIDPVPIHWNTEPGPGIVTGWAVPEGDIPDLS